MGEKENAKYVNKAEFFAMMVAVFSFIFAVHVAPTIRFRWFFEYITVVIVIVQLICLYSFIQYLKRK